MNDGFKNILINEKMQYVNIFLILLVCSNFNTVEANISMDGMLGHSIEKTNKHEFQLRMWKYLGVPCG